MGTGIGAQVLKEVQEMREDIHRIDTRLEVHIATDKQNGLKLDRVYKDYYGNGDCEGTKSQVHSARKNSENKRSFNTEFTIKLSTGIILLLLTIALNIIATRLIP